MPRLRPALAGAVVAGAALAAAARAAGAQPRPVALPVTDRALAAALASLRTDNAWTLAQQASICEIPAPPFKEQARAAEYMKRLAAVGVDQLRTDAVGNVIGVRRGAGRGPLVVLSAHLDTVFPEGTDVRVTRDTTGGRTVLRGPGIGDDCRGLAAVLAVVRAMHLHGVRTAGDVLVVATVGEEGAGNLRGVRHLFTGEYKGRIGYFLSVDGTGFGVVTGAVGSHRYRVRYTGPGGHSYGAFGMPNPAHALGRAIARVSDFTVPASPRTTFSVSVLGGGTSVNSIPAEAVMEVDMRSESEASLAELDARFQGALRAALAEEKARWPDSRAPLALHVDTIGIRPAGTQPDSAHVVRVAVETARHLGFPVVPQASSTDANVPIALGVPALTLDAAGRGRGAHALDESYEDGPNGFLGPQWVALVVATLAGIAK